MIHKSPIHTVGSFARNWSEFVADVYDFTIVFRNERNSKRSGGLSAIRPSSLILSYRSSEKY